MDVENVSSEIQLKREIYISARDGKAASIIEKLRKMDKSCGIVQEILDHHTEEENEIMTPLIISARNGHKHVVTVLLRLGADVEQTGTIVIKEQIIKGATPLWCAAAVGHLGIVKLLVEYGANVNSKTSTNSTPIRAACYDGTIDIVKYLVEHGADINALNTFQANCLSLACHHGHYSLAKYLIKKGIDINQMYTDGRTTLNILAKKGEVKMIDLLLMHGAKITRNKDNDTPLMIAALNGKSDAVDYFVRKTDNSRDDIVDALEILGTRFAIDNEEIDTDKAYYYLKKAMEVRQINKRSITEKSYLSPIPSYDNWIECRNISELEAIKENNRALKMECLAKRERILGSCHPDVIKSIVYVADGLIDDHDYTRGLNLWHYALKQYRDTQEYMYVTLWFPETLAYMIKMNTIPPYDNYRFRYVSNIDD